MPGLLAAGGPTRFDSCHRVDDSQRTWFPVTPPPGEHAVSSITLYDFPLSGNCHKVRLLLSMLDLDYERVPIDVVANQTASAAFKRINPRDQVPFLVDGEVRIWDSMAILIYLARRYGSTRWLPNEPAAEAVVMQWLALAGDELLYGLARARAVWRLGKDFNREQCQQEGRGGLTLMEQQLELADWLAA